MPPTISTILEVATAIAAIIALPLIVLQLRQQNKQQRFEALGQVHKEVAAVEFREALRSIFAVEPEELAATKSVALMEQIDDATAVYDLAGLRIQEGVLPKEATLKTEWKILLPLWSHLEGFVITERQRRGVPYKEHFEWLAGEAELYRQQHYPAADPQVVRRQQKDQF